MKKNIDLERRKGINRDIRDSIDKTLQESSSFLQKHFNDFKIDEYVYSEDKAIEELGLDSELIHELVEDYVVQVLKSNMQFIEYIEELKIDKENEKPLNYTPLRELAHKNLGVARNLRIVDSQIFLEELMKKTDLNYISLSREALYHCAVRLKPKCAYVTLKLIKVKNSF